jgi:hypothetical protein
MAILASAAEATSRRLPKFITPDVHCTSDYVLSGTMIAGGLALWRKERRAAVASLLCGGALLGLSLVTHYPGRKRKPIAFHRHAEAEKGMAILLATLPGVLLLEKNLHRYFTFHAAALTALTNLTFVGKRDHRIAQR